MAASPAPRWRARGLGQQVVDRGRSPVSRTARYRFMGTRGLRPRDVTVYFHTNPVGTIVS